MQRFLDTGRKEAMFLISSPALVVCLAASSMGGTAACGSSRDNARGQAGGTDAAGGGIDFDMDGTLGSTNGDVMAVDCCLSALARDGLETGGFESCGWGKLHDRFCRRVFTPALHGRSHLEDFIFGPIAEGTEG